MTRTGLTRDMESKECRSDSVSVPARRQITPRMRTAVVAWLLDKCLWMSLQFTTFVATVTYLDKFLRCADVPFQQLQMYCATALFLASKMDELFPLQSTVLVHVCNNSFTEEELLAAEQEMIRVLDFRLFYPFVRMRGNSTRLAIALYLVRRSAHGVHKARARRIISSVARRLANNASTLSTRRGQPWPSVFVEQLYDASLEMGRARVWYQSCLNQNAFSWTSVFMHP